MDGFFSSSGIIKEKLEFCSNQLEDVYVSRSLKILDGSGSIEASKTIVWETRKMSGERNEVVYNEERSRAERFVWPKLQSHATTLKIRGFEAIRCCRCIHIIQALQHQQVRE